MPKSIRRPESHLHQTSFETRGTIADQTQTPVRINKALADAGLCSRRKAEEWILAGRVRVNGIVVDNLGHKVSPGTDCIEVDGNPLKTTQARTYLMLHKPIQVVCTVRDPQGRTTIMDILPKDYTGTRLYPVGRLDFFSEGLLILTDDGELTQRLAHPRHHLPKKYDVLVRGEVPEAALNTMRRGMTLAEGEKLAPVDVRVLPAPQKKTTLLQMTLQQGLNRQIRRMCRDLGLTILMLKRVAQGPLELGALPAGSTRPLTTEELVKLRSAVGLR